jgi:hypothetical protein
LSGRDGFGALSITGVTRRLTGRCLGMTGRVRSVLLACCERVHWCVWSGNRGTTNAKDRSDAVARPVTIDRTHLVAIGCLLESTGRWHYGVWSVQAARPVSFSVARALGDRMLGRVRTVLIGTSDHLSVRVTSFLDCWRSCDSVLYLYTWK